MPPSLIALVSRRRLRRLNLPMKWFRSYRGWNSSNSTAWISELDDGNLSCLFNFLIHFVKLILNL